MFDRNLVSAMAVGALVLAGCGATSAEPIVKPTDAVRLSDRELTDCLSTMYSLYGEGDPDADMLRQKWDRFATPEGASDEEAQAYLDASWAEMMGDQSVARACGAILD